GELAQGGTEVKAAAGFDLPADAGRARDVGAGAAGPGRLGVGEAMLGEVPGGDVLGFPAARFAVVAGHRAPPSRAMSETLGDNSTSTPDQWKRVTPRRCSRTSTWSPVGVVRKCSLTQCRRAGRR